MHVGLLERLKGGQNSGRHLEMQPALRLDTVKNVDSRRTEYAGEIHVTFENRAGPGEGPEVGAPRPVFRPGEARAKGHAGHSVLENGEENVFHLKDNLVDRILDIVQEATICKDKKKKSHNSLCFSHEHTGTLHLWVKSPCSLVCELITPTK